MRPLSQLLLLITLASLSSGCAMCCSPFDNAYGYTGGRWQRDDLCHGRVGSAFAPAGGPTGYVSSESSAEPIPAELPPPPAKAAPLKSVKRVRPTTAPSSARQN